MPNLKPARSARTDSARLTRRERKKQNLKYSVLESTLQLAETKGFDKITIAQIAEKAGISYATFFNYFKSKEDLLEEIEKMECEDLNEIIEISYKDESDIGEIIRGVFEVWVRDTHRYRHGAVRIFEVLMKRSEGTFNPPMTSLFESLIIRGQESGQFRPEADAHVFAMLLEGLHEQLVFTDSIDKLEEATGEIIRALSV